MNKVEIKIFKAENWADYELLDTGGGEKLERFGKYYFIRPYEEAVWAKSNIPEWQKADARFVSGKEGAKGRFEFMSKVEEKWVITYKDIKFYAQPTTFRHLGFFPEQAVHWDFIETSIRKAVQSSTLHKPVKFLNLFGYTGVASLFALKAGADVTHLDASKQSLDLAKENQNLNGELKDKPMRVILDDALKFLAREAKRGNKYDAVIMDPPKFGRGPKGEVWKIEEMLPKLLQSVRQVLSEQPLFVVLTSYATDNSPLSLGYALKDAFRELSGKVEQGELCLTEKSNDRAITLANTAVWTTTN